MARERGIRSAKEIGFYIGRTERLVEEYLQLIAHAERDSRQRKRLASIKLQMRYIEQLHQEFFPQRNRLQFGDLVWQTTKDDGQRPTYGKKTEDYAVETVILPLIRTEDVERRIYFKKGDRNSNYKAYLISDW